MPTPPKKPEVPPEVIHIVETDATSRLRVVIAALLEAPNPRIAGGSPAYWQWYDNVRKQALEQAEQT